MDKRLKFASIFVAAMAASTLALASEPKGAEAEIHFPNSGGIYSWHADDDNALWIQSRDRQWYYAKLLGPCSGLPFATGIGFVADPSSSLDRFGAIVVDKQKCPIRSLVKSDPPPKK